MDFGLISMDGAEFIQVSIDTKNSKKKPFTVAEITMFPLKTFSEIEYVSMHLTLCKSRRKNQLQQVQMPLIPCIFSDSSSSEEESKKENMKLKKPIYLRDIERKELLEKGRLVQ